MIKAVRRIKLVAASAATFLLLATGAAHAQERIGLMVDGQTVEGNSRIAGETFLSQTGIRTGDTITINDLQVAIRRLWASGQYKNLEPRLIQQPEVNHVVLHWKIEEQPWINRVEFKGLENIKASEITDKTKIAGGGPLRPARVV